LKREKGRKRKVATTKVMILPIIAVFPICSALFNSLAVLTCIAGYRRT
jgi:hypothetical protein